MIHGLKPSLAEGGKIKTGGLGEERPSRSGGTYRMPRKDDHFTITLTRRNDAGDLLLNNKIMAELVGAGYGSNDGKLRAIPIVLHSDDIDEVFPTAYVAYHGKKLRCKGDGKTARRREFTPQGEWTGTENDHACPCDWLEADAQGVRRCKPSGTLYCSIRVPGQAVAGSVYRWRTTSIISIQQMVGSLLQIQQTVGVIQGLPLVLRIRPIVVTPQGRTTTVYVCHVELRAVDLQTVQRQALELAQMRQSVAQALGASPAASYRAMLQAPGDEPDDEQADVAEEYYPDAVVGADGATLAQPPGALTDEQRALLQTPTATAPKAKYPDNMQPVNNPGPPPSEQPPEPQRTRKTRCKGCGDLFGPGVVKGGLCDGCRTPEPEQEPEAPAAEPDPAPEIVSRPPARPSTATTTTPSDGGRAHVTEIFRARAAAGARPMKILAAVTARWPDADDRDWTPEDLEQLKAVLDAVPCE